MSARFKRFLGPMKWALALALLAFAFSSGRVDPQAIKSFFSDPVLAIACVIIALLWYGFAFWRWAILLESQEMTLPYREVFKVCMASQFAQIFMPGTVGADAFKAFHVMRRYPKAKARALSTVFVDRVLGLFSLLLMAGLGILVSAGRSRELSSLTIWVLSLSSVGLLALLILPWLAKRLTRERYGALERLPFQRELRHFKSILLNYTGKGAALWKGLLLSMLSQLMGVLILFLAAWKTSGNPPWGAIGPIEFLSAALLGSVVMGLPLAPMGLGVGQMAFAGIFKLFGAPSATFGPSLVTNQQIVSLFVNLLGFFFFLGRKEDFRRASEAA
jgi:uncharacterized protein (TIRG00374 family)